MKTNTIFDQATDRILIPETNMLRGVNRENAEYQDLNDSIAINGVKEPITIRPLTEEEKALDVDNRYDGALVNGMQRLDIAKRLGIQYIMCMFIDVTSEEGLIEQITRNLNVKTPASAIKKVIKQLSDTLGLSKSEIAGILKMSELQLSKYAKLDGLSDDVVELVDTGKISLTNAMLLVNVKGLNEEQFNELVTKSQVLKRPELEKEIRKMKPVISKEDQIAELIALEFEPSPDMNKQRLVELYEQAQFFEADDKEPHFTCEDIRRVFEMDAETLEIKRDAFEEERAAKLAKLTPKKKTKDEIEAINQL